MAFQRDTIPNEKFAKDLNRHSSKDIQMDNACVQMLPAIREMQSKSARSYHFIPTGMAVLKKTP
jgi:hypothetical protein